MGNTTEIGAVRSATKEDVVAALGPAMRVVTSPKILREAHHRVLRLVAVGYRMKDIVAKTGYSPNRVGQIIAAPAAKSEILRLRGEIEKRMINTHVEDDLEDIEIDRLTLTFLKRQRHERIVSAYEAGEPIPLRDETTIIADLEDRIGTPRKSTNVNAYVNMASSLEEAIRRSEAVTIDQPKVAAE